MSLEEMKQSLNVNSYLSIGVVVVIISATLWINNSIHEVQIRQMRQEERQDAHNSSVQAKIDAMGARIDGLVTKPELEASISAIRLENSKLELQILRANAPGRLAK